MKRSTFLLILFLSIVVKSLLAFSTFHPDIVAFNLAGRLVREGNIFNLYDYIGNLSVDHPLRKVYPPDVFICPPVVYLFFGFVSITLNKIVPVNLVENMIYNLNSVLGTSQFNWFLFLFKISYLPFDLGISFLLFKLLKKDRHKLLAFIFWIFNPVAIYVTYMQGQFDIIPTFFVVLSLYILTKKTFSSIINIYLASFCLGLGASFKVYPLLFILPVAMLASKWRDKIGVFVVGLGTYLLTLLPFLGSAGFRSSALVAGHTLKSFYAQIPVSGGQSIILYLASIIFVYLVFYYHKVEQHSIWQRFFVILLIFFVFTHYHPQWFLWLTPFLIIDLVKSDLEHCPLVFISLFSFIALLFFFDPSLTIGLFSPVYPVLANSQSIWYFLGLNLDINFLRSVFHTLFVSVAIYYFYFLIFYGKTVKIGGDKF